MLNQLSSIQQLPLPICARIMLAIYQPDTVDITLQLRCSLLWGVGDNCLEFHG